MSTEQGKFIPPDPEITRYSTGHWVQVVTVNENYVLIEDPMVGDFPVSRDRSNGLFYDYMVTPNAYRSGGISQLCKDRTSSTIPNAASMTRRSHNNGLFRLVDVLSERERVGEERNLAYHLMTDVEDQGQPEFSHGTEQLIQFWGGPENWHELHWPENARHGGTVRMLEKHGVKVNDQIRIPGIAVPPWIGDEAPDVTLDRFHYAVSEMLLWYDNDAAPKEARELVQALCSPDNLVITEDGKLAFTDVEIARIFSKGYLLLATEHWNDPINRVQLHLLIQATQRAIVRRRMSWMNEVDKNQTRQPEGYLLGIDQDIVDAMEDGCGQADPFMSTIKNTLYPIAIQERSSFIDYKLKEYSAFLIDPHAKDYPSQYLSPKRVEFGPPATQVSVSMRRSQVKSSGARAARFDLQAPGIRYRLSPLKNRYVDPLITTSKGVQRLSEIDSNYQHLLQEQQELQAMSATVELAFAGKFQEVFKNGVTQNDSEFAEIRKGPDMTDDQKRQVIEGAARRAKSIGVAAGTLILKHAS